MKIRFPLRGASRRQLRARLAIAAKAMGAKNIPAKDEADAATELAYIMGHRILKVRSDPKLLQNPDYRTMGSWTDIALSISEIGRALRLQSSRPKQSQIVARIGKTNLHQAARESWFVRTDQLEQRDRIRISGAESDKLESPTCTHSHSLARTRTKKRKVSARKA